MPGGGLRWKKKEGFPAPNRRGGGRYSLAGKKKSEDLRLSLFPGGRKKVSEANGRACWGLEAFADLL